MSRPSVCGFGLNISGLSTFPVSLGYSHRISMLFAPLFLHFFFVVSKSFLSINFMHILVLFCGILHTEIFGKTYEVLSLLVFCLLVVFVENMSIFLAHNVLPYDRDF